MKIFILLILTLFSAGPLGASSPAVPVSDISFNGTWSVLPGGGLELSMRDGSRLFLGPGTQVNPRSIGKTDQPSLRKNPQGKVIFAADRRLILIYTFRYTRDGTGVVMTDPEAKITRFRFDGTTGMIKEIQPPSGKRYQFP